MQTVFRLAYSLVVALLLVLVVILGTRTFYAEPHMPAYPQIPQIPSGPKQLLVGGDTLSGTGLSCDFQARSCSLYYSAIPPQNPGLFTLEEARRLYPEEVAIQEERYRIGQEYNIVYEKYRDDLVDYRRNVFILANLLGVVGVAGGLIMFRRVDAIPLGLLLGGAGAVIYGSIQASEDFDEIGTEFPFAVAAGGLLLVLAAGYRLLGMRRSAGERAADRMKGDDHGYRVQNRL